MSSANPPELTIADLQVTATPEERARYRARVIEQGERSFLDDRMNVGLPDHLYGEWVSIDDYSQTIAAQNGFVDGTQFLKKDKFLHAHPEGGRVGDVRFMVCAKWQHEEREKVKKELTAKKHGLNVDVPGRALRNQLANEGLNPDSDSTVTQAVDGEALAQLLK